MNRSPYYAHIYRTGEDVTLPYTLARATVRAERFARDRQSRVDVVYIGRTNEWTVMQIQEPKRIDLFV